MLRVGWLCAFAGFVLGVGSFVLLMMLRTSRARVSASLREFLSEYASGILLLALILEVAGLFAPEAEVNLVWLYVVLILAAWPAFGIYRALTFEETVHITSSSSRPSPKSYDERPATKSARAPIADEWQTKILEVMGAQPDGLSLVEIGNKLGVDWRQLTVAVRQLVHDGKLRKEGKNYYRT